MDGKVKNTLNTPQVQKTEYVKRNLPTHSKRISSSITHPSVSMSSRKFSAVSFLLENNDIIQKIPSHMDPSMFSDDEDDKIEEEDLNEQEEEDLNEHKEENLGAAGLPVESNESHLQAVSSMLSGSSTTNTELHSSSSFKSAGHMHSTRVASVMSVERKKAQNENRFLYSADFRSCDAKHLAKSEATSSREKIQNVNKFQHSADFRSLDAKHLVKSEVASSREKMWTEKRLQDIVDHESGGPKHSMKLVPILPRSTMPKRQDNTIEDFNWRKINSKPISHQASSLIKSQHPVMKKIDELPNKITDQKITEKSSERGTASFHRTLERAKSHGDLCSGKENVPQCNRKGLGLSVKSHSHSKREDNPNKKEKPAPSVSRENLKSNEKQSASQESSGKTSNDKDEKSKVNVVIPDGVITVNNKPYLVLATLGSGGSCKVYSAYDSGTQSMYAIKCVSLGPGDMQIMDGYKKEIEYLQKLQGSNRVIKMFDYEYLETEIRILLEKGDTDFAHYITNEMKIKPLSPIMIKFYWSQMLEAVAEIHKLGIVHSDLKPANFLLVAGQLKLIDFGIAASVPADMTSAIRESQVGTLNFISPEALTTHYSDNENQNYIIKIGVKSDVWSLGCILYNLIYGHTPFSSIKNIIPKMRAIIDAKHEIQFPPIEDQMLLDVLKRCLKRNPKERASVEELLKHPYLTSEAKKEVFKTPVKSRIKFQDMLTQLESLTPNRMSVVSEVLQKMQSVKKH